MSDFKELAARGKAWDRLIPMADTLQGFPTVRAEQQLARKIRFGQPIGLSEIPMEPGSHEKKYIKVVDRDCRLLAVLKPGNEKNVYEYSCVLNA